MKLAGDQSLSMLAAREGDEYTFVGSSHPFLRLFVGAAKGSRAAFGHTGTQYESLPYPSTLPAFRSVVWDEEGEHLWIEEFELDAITSGAKGRWSVYAEDGRLLGEVLMPTGVELFRVGEDYVLGLWRDELKPSTNSSTSSTVL